MQIVNQGEQPLELINVDNGYIRLKLPCCVPVDAESVDFYRHEDTMPNSDPTIVEVGIPFQGKFRGRFKPGTISVRY